MNADDIQALLQWYRATRRDLPWRRTRNIYRIWVSEVMLQQTQVATATPYYRRFLARFPTVAALAAAPLDDVLKAWEVGYYGRARNLHAAARQVVTAHGGRVPRTPAAFRRLPGVGDTSPPRCSASPPGSRCRWWTATCCGCGPAGAASARGRPDGPRPEPDPPRAGRRDPPAAPGDQALMELGARVCAAPRCAECPLAVRCAARRAGVAAALPVRAARRVAPLRRVVVAVIVRRGRMFIQQRPADGFLGGLWEFPRRQDRAGRDARGGAGARVPRGDRRGAGGGRAAGGGAARVQPLSGAPARVRLPAGARRQAPPGGPAAGVTRRNWTTTPSPGRTEALPAAAGAPV